MAESSRSPIKDKPLRHAGQSLEEERRGIFDDKIEPWLLIALLFTLFAGWEWWRYLMDAPPRPGIVSIFAACASAFAAWRIWRLRPKLKALRLGIDGERAVGQFLERLRESGYQVFHDVQAPGFNIDHVLIGRAGVFAVETKTWSKPARGEAQITFKEGQLLAGTLAVDRDPLGQARGQAAWLWRLLEESTGQAPTVTPVVLLPGWFIQQSPDRPKDVWVLEPKALLSFIEQEPTRLTPASAKLTGFHLSRFIRSAERERAES